MDENEQESALGNLANEIDAWTGGRFRCPLELLTRLVALTGGVLPRHVVADLQPAELGLEADVVLFTESAVIRGHRPVEGEVWVLAFPRSDLVQVELIGGGRDDWEDERNPPWPPHGRLRLTYRGREPFVLPPGDKPMRPQQRERLGLLAPELVNDLGR